MPLTRHLKFSSKIRHDDKEDNENKHLIKRQVFKKQNHAKRGGNDAGVIIRPCNVLLRPTSPPLK